MLGCTRSVWETVHTWRMKNEAGEWVRAIETLERAQLRELQHLVRIEGLKPPAPIPTPTLTPTLTLTLTPILTLTLILTPALTLTLILTPALTLASFTPSSPHSSPTSTACVRAERGTRWAGT